MQPPPPPPRRVGSATRRALRRLSATAVVLVLWACVAGRADAGASEPLQPRHDETEDARAHVEQPRFASLDVALISGNPRPNPKHKTQKEFSVESVEERFVASLNKTGRALELDLNWFRSVIHNSSQPSEVRIAAFTAYTKHPAMNYTLAENLLRLIPMTLAADEALNLTSWAAKAYEAGLNFSVALSALVCPPSNHEDADDKQLRLRLRQHFSRLCSWGGKRASLLAARLIVACPERDLVAGESECGRLLIEHVAPTNLSAGYRVVDRPADFYERVAFDRDALSIVDARAFVAHHLEGQLEQPILQRKVLDMLKLDERSSFSSLKSLRLFVFEVLRLRHVAWALDHSVFSAMCQWLSREIERSYFTSSKWDLPQEQSLAAETIANAVRFNLTQVREAANISLWAVRRRANAPGLIELHNSLADLFKKAKKEIRKWQSDLSARDKLNESTEIIKALRPLMGGVETLWIEATEAEVNATCAWLQSNSEEANRSANKAEGILLEMAKVLPESLLRALHSYEQLSLLGPLESAGFMAIAQAALNLSLTNPLAARARRLVLERSTELAPLLVLAPSLEPQEAANLTQRFLDDVHLVVVAAAAHRERLGNDEKWLGETIKALIALRRTVTSFSSGRAPTLALRSLLSSVHRIPGKYLEGIFWGVGGGTFAAVDLILAASREGASEELRREAMGLADHLAHSFTLERYPNDISPVARFSLCKAFSDARSSWYGKSSNSTIRELGRKVHERLLKVTSLDSALNEYGDGLNLEALRSHSKEVYDHFNGIGKELARRTMWEAKHTEGFAKNNPQLVQKAELVLLYRDYLEISALAVTPETRKHVNRYEYEKWSEKVLSTKGMAELVREVSKDKVKMLRWKEGGENSRVSRHERRMATVNYFCQMALRPPKASMLFDGEQLSKLSLANDESEMRTFLTWRDGKAAELEGAVAFAEASPASRTRGFLELDQALLNEIKAHLPPSSAKAPQIDVVKAVLEIDNAGMQALDALTNWWYNDPKNGEPGRDLRAQYRESPDFVTRFVRLRKWPAPLQLAVRESGMRGTPSLMAVAVGVFKLLRQGTGDGSGKDMVEFAFTINDVVGSSAQLGTAIYRTFEGLGKPTTSSSLRVAASSIEKADKFGKALGVAGSLYNYVSNALKSAEQMREGDYGAATGYALASVGGAVCAISFLFGPAAPAVLLVGLTMTLVGGIFTLFDDPAYKQLLQKYHLWKN
jgi:hypothetical protein